MLGVIKTFTSKKGNQVVLRYPQKEDLEELLRFINELSKEDTFINYSGEEISRSEEEQYVTSILEEIEKKTRVHVLAFVKGVLIGGCEISRLKRRMSHVGYAHIAVSKDYRNEGIGKNMLLTVIEEGKKIGIKLLGIEVFANNTTAYQLYKNIGFREHGRFPKAIQYKGELVDKIELHKEL